MASGPPTDFMTHKISKREFFDHHHGGSGGCLYLGTARFPLPGRDRFEAAPFELERRLAGFHRRTRRIGFPRKCPVVSTPICWPPKKFPIRFIVTTKRRCNGLVKVTGCTSALLTCRKRFSKMTVSCCAAKGWTRWPASKSTARKLEVLTTCFRLWEFDVKSIFARRRKHDRDHLRVTVHLHQTACERRSGAAKFIRERAWVRKEPCSFGWDWGPVLASCGIWKNISLETFNQGRIANVLVQQHLDGKHKATLDVDVKVESAGQTSRPFQAVLTVLEQGRTIAKKKIKISNDPGRGQLEIKHPKLWWPAGMGGQPLYEVHVELLDADGNPSTAPPNALGCAN